MEEANVPFLKWAGGKRWLIRNGAQLAPVRFNTYIEPFLGSGAVFFSLNPSRSILADVNTELVDTYNAIKTNWKEVESQLRRHERNHDDSYYYKLRDSRPRTNVTRAARFIYLNRTCWNGLYRVNLNGKFNVPRGSKNNVVLDTDDFKKTSDLLQNSQVLSQDFEITLSRARKGDFVYVDPPYTVNHNQNGFLKYNNNIFSWEDQIRLKNAIVRAVRRGAMVTVSNADHDSIHNLYRDIGDPARIERSSVIAGQSEYRKQTTEVLMRLGWDI
ncbi:MAG: Dam family site-specific DNA-(adenine-N6)-methyltransferase [Chloracidobacterium sp.]|nr:Dam family site-specific DNA-(adenine-N6)-methyltransferase [Chloracidobacterium sp.]MBK9767641.1 Dam family site-specific DNA-(adenine-N6)-methyltransferase [Chloracidobacterium sp.]MBL0240888.1 Dam family site-specific DNA-(adenine-N6)-methyltransferase [Chloracidobacterium sp.]